MARALLIATVLGTAAALHRPAVRFAAASRPALRTTRLFGTSTVEADEAKAVPYSSLKVGVLKETQALEKRCSQSPGSVGSLVKAGFNVQVERNAGTAAGFSDEAYEGQCWAAGGHKKIQQEVDELNAMKSAAVKVLSMGTASKLCSLTGWRVGWLIGPEELIGGCKALHG